MTVDREEIQVVGRLARAGGRRRSAPPSGRGRRGVADRGVPRGHAGGADALAREAQHRFRRKVSWGAEAGDTRQLFTTLALPVMTRLRMADREVLDTLVESGVARSRAHALAWCVKLVGEKQSEWISELREALADVERVRAQGPGGARSEVPV